MLCACGRQLCSLNREIASRGGIVWTDPQTLPERIAMKAALSGEGTIEMKGPFDDPRYQGED